MSGARKAMAVLLGAAALALGYVLCAALEVPMLWLDAKQHVLSFGARPSPEAMDFFGRMLWSASAAAAGALAGAIARPSPRAVRVATGFTAVVMAACFALETTRVMRRVPRQDGDSWRLVQR